MVIHWGAEMTEQQLEVDVGPPGRKHGCLIPESCCRRIVWKRMAMSQASDESLGGATK